MSMHVMGWMVGWLVGWSFDQHLISRGGCCMKPWNNHMSECQTIECRHQSSDTFRCEQFPIASWSVYCAPGSKLSRPVRKPPAVPPGNNVELICWI